MYFGTELVTYKIKFNDTFLIVEAPESPIGKTTVQLFIHYKGVIYSSDNLVYVYKEYFDIYSISPLRGPSRGGTVVEILGSNFDENTWCVFDAKYIAVAIFLSKQMLHCKSPSH